MVAHVRWRRRLAAAAVVLTMIGGGCGRSQGDHVRAGGDPGTSASPGQRWMLPLPAAASDSRDGDDETVDPTQVGSEDRLVAERLVRSIGDGATLASLSATKVSDPGDAPYTIVTAQVRNEMSGLTVSWHQLLQPVEIVPQDQSRDAQAITTRYSHTNVGELLEVIPKDTRADGFGSSLSLVSPTGLMVDVVLNGHGLADDGAGSQDQPALDASTPFTFVDARRAATSLLSALP